MIQRATPWRAIVTVRDCAVTVPAAFDACRRSAPLHLAFQLPRLPLPVQRGTLGRRLSRSLKAYLAQQSTRDTLVHWRPLRHLSLGG